MFDDISIERKKELQKKVLPTINYVTNKYYRKELSNAELVEGCIHYYKKLNNDNLKISEHNYFLLQILIPDDNEFLECCNLYSKKSVSKYVPSIDKYDFKKIAKHYGITEKIAIQRYRVMLDNFRNEIVKKNIKKK